jgi:hypothetical protein
MSDREKGKRGPVSRRAMPAEISERVDEALKEMESIEAEKLGEEEEISIFESDTPLWYVAYKTAI